MTVVYERSGDSVENRGGDPYPMRKFLAPGKCDWLINWFINKWVILRIKNIYFKGKLYFNNSIYTQFNQIYIFKMNLY